MRIIFMGSAELATPILQGLHSQPNWKVVAVVTQPDRPKGRDLKLQPGPVKSAALGLNLPVLQPEKARNPEFVAELRSVNPDLFVVAAYGQILPQAILDLPRFGCLNVHTSLLPKYRGAAPIQWAILDDQPVTGVTIMKMDAGLDTGMIVTQQETPILPEDTGQTLHDRLGKMGAELLLQTIPGYAEGKIIPRPQPAIGASYARKITKEDGLIDWGRPAKEIWNKVRAFNPWPGGFTHTPDGKLLKLWETAVEPDKSGAPGQVLALDKSGIMVASGAGALRVLSLQREGGRRMSAQEFLTGHSLKIGDQLG